MQFASLAGETLMLIVATGGKASYRQDFKLTVARRVFSNGELLAVSA